MHASPEVIVTWQRFAEVTIKTNDLDPMYSVIRGLNQTKSREWMGRFLMYFLMFYEAGDAAFTADNLDGLPEYEFWNEVRNCDIMKFKRGTERRHFRGENAKKAIARLTSFELSSWELIEEMYPPGTGVPTYTEFYQHMTTYFAGTQMGPYFIWKLFDIFNLCLDWPISMTIEEAVKYMPDEPRKSAAHFFPNYTFQEAIMEVVAEINDYDHPVVPGRKCGYAEAETILCMMKGAFWTKSHRIGDDIDEKRAQLNWIPALQAMLPEPVTGQYEVGGEFTI